MIFIIHPILIISFLYLSARKASLSKHSFKTCINKAFEESSKVYNIPNLIKSSTGKRFKNFVFPGKVN